MTSNTPSDWSICYVTSVLIGLLQVPINDDKATSLLIGLSVLMCLIGLLQVPINDDKATSLLIGLSLETKKEHIVRAVLESLAFRFTLLYETLLNEIKTRMSFLVRCDLVIIIIIINKVLIKVTLNKVIAGALYIVICG